jgi:hypothetical protein
MRVAKLTGSGRERMDVDLPYMSSVERSYPYELVQGRGVFKLIESRKFQYFDCEMGYGT